MHSPVIQSLIDALRVLPGVGPKSAQRMAIQLLDKQRIGAEQLVFALQKALNEVAHCPSCRMLSEQSPCRICADVSRDSTQLCVVESLMDVVALEQSGSYRGRYFVLLGRLSPIDGIGPNELGLPALLKRLSDGEVTELIIATNPTMEGEATAHYLREATRRLPLTVSRIAHGVPIGGELEFVDGNTLTHAFKGRRVVE